MEQAEWTLVFTSSQVLEAEILKGMLTENDIECVIINKRDSSYLIGEAEVYVKTGDAFLAMQLINGSKA